MQQTGSSQVVHGSGAHVGAGFKPAPTGNRIRAYIANNPVWWANDPESISRAVSAEAGRVSNPYALTYADCVELPSSLAMRFVETSSKAGSRFAAALVADASDDGAEDDSLKQQALEAPEGRLPQRGRRRGESRGTVQRPPPAAGQQSAWHRSSSAPGRGPWLVVHRGAAGS